MNPLNAYQMTAGDYIGWFWAISGTTLIICLLSAIIYYIWQRARWYARGGGSSSLASSDSVILDRILAKIEEKRRIAKEKEEVEAKYESRINKLEQDIDALKRQAQDSVMLRKELEQRSLIPATTVTPLLAVFGPDEDLERDLVSLRAVERETGMDFRRVRDATFAKIKRYLDQGRVNGRPYTKMHMAVHAGDGGIFLGPERIDGLKFSEILDGVEILLIAGCEGNEIGDWIGRVAHVITISEQVAHKDASLFARAFWTQIGNGKNPDEAVNVALNLAPSGMDEYVEKHW